MPDLTDPRSREPDAPEGQQLSSTSWVDRLMARLESLPGPPWLAYILLTLALALLGHVVRWMDGSLPAGAFDVARLAEAPMAFIMLALMHYLNRNARTAVSSFRPALEITDSEVRRHQHEIATIPRSHARIATASGLGLAAVGVISNPASWGVTEPLTTGSLIHALLVASLVFVFGSVFMVHTVRQLRLVDRIHGIATNINLWHRLPVYSFSTLTAQTGIGIVFIIYYYVFLTYTLDLYGPVELSAFDAFFLAILILLAIASFVVPLHGMHRRLTREKRRLVAEADRRFERTLTRLHELVDSESLEGLDGLNKTFTSLLIERDALAKISTWPWRPETLRGFLSSIAIPIALWLVTNFLGQVLGLR